MALYVAVRTDEDEGEDSFYDKERGIWVSDICDATPFETEEEAKLYGSQVQRVQ